MEIAISPLIQAAELLNIYTLQNVVLIDVSNGKMARANYEKIHLKGALFVDLNTQLAEIKENISEGGRHPLPTIENFAKTLSHIGITTKSHVIVYDDKNGANAAARFWWMLKAVGHHKVQVLNGGLQEALKLNFATSSGNTIAYQKEAYKVSHWKLPIASIEEVEKDSINNDGLIIDVREANRYNGLTEPIDLIAGHIPNAINIPFTENLDENGLFLAPHLLKAKYEKILQKTKLKNSTIHCGSGVTACHTVFAIAYAGLPIPKLYIGSWSEWSRNNKKIVSK